MNANKLKKAFDFQKFEQNAHLAKLIQETEHRTNRDAYAMDDDELDAVAGGKILSKEPKLIKGDSDSKFIRC